MYQDRYECDCGYDECDCNEECFHDMNGCAQPECFAGPAGPMGPRGPRGPQGPRGIQGPQGKEGTQGPRGPQGITGPQGVAGIQGIQGPTGPAGIAGVTGAMGMTGAQGPQGPRGATGPAGETPVLPQFASGALYSYSCKQVNGENALVFDISNIQSGVRISEDYTTLIMTQPGTYVVEFGMFVASMPCEGDAIALELNHKLLVEESRMPVYCQNAFITGTCILSLQAEDELCLVADSSDCFELFCCNNTINAYVVIHQINA